MFFIYLFNLNLKKFLLKNFHIILSKSIIIEFNFNNFCIYLKTFFFYKNMVLLNNKGNFQNKEDKIKINV